MARPLGPTPGGILGLRRLLEEHGGAVEASLAAHYPGVRLGHLYTGGLTARALLVYLRHLPPASPLGVALRGQAARWGVAEHLLATVADLLAGGNWQRGGGKGAKPKPLQRPDGRAERRREQYVHRLKRLGLIAHAGG